MDLSVVILAAGQGTRMKSALPKVLHCIANKPMLEHVIDTAFALEATNVHVVYGHGGEQVKEQLASKEVNWVLQAEQLGTGHAVQQVVDHIGDEENILILYGDVPLIKKETLQNLLQTLNETKLAVLTANLDDATGYGRIIRDEANKILRIVEHKDASDEEKCVTEINTGIIAANGQALTSWLNKLENNNAQKEYYLTDVIASAVNENIDVASSQPGEFEETLGVNDRVQLAELERYYQKNKAEELMRQGVTIMDPARIDIRGNVSIGKDSLIDINVVLAGDVKIGNNVRIGAGSYITDAVIGDGVNILPNSVIEQAKIGADCNIGPFARIRPGTELVAKVNIGNFVEIKNAHIEEGSKVNHLSYIGDSELGKKVNIGAGTITCNYDGANKHKTVIEDNVFVGSDSQLVAPVKIGRGATIGAGSTITKNVPNDALVTSRVKQKIRDDWQRPVKKK